MDCQNRGSDGQAAIRVPRVGPVSHVPRIGPAMPRPGACGLPVMSVNGRLPDRTGRVTLGFSDLFGIDYATVAELVEAATGRRLVVVDEEVDWTGVSANPVRNGAVAAAIAARYEKPAGGIPASDLASGVTGLLNGALQMTPEALYALLAGKSDKSDTYTAAQADAAIAKAIAAVVNAAPAAFDTLKEIADWIGDDQSGAAAMAAAIANKVDKVSGKGLSTNDYTTTEKDKLSGVEMGAKDNVVEAASVSVFPQTGATGKIYVAKDENKTYRWDGTQYVQVGGSSIDIVAPSTDPADAGKAADAKATGDALALRPTKSQIDAGWWSEWTVSAAPETSGAYYRVDRDTSDWLLVEVNGARLIPVESISATGGDEDQVSELVFPYMRITATRHRVAAPVPTKTSDLTNDGPDGAHPFISQHQQLTPVYGGNGERFSDWTFSNSGSYTITGPVQMSPDPSSEWIYVLLDHGITYPPVETFASEELARAATTQTYFGIVTATRTENPIIGYTLGSQTTKPLQPKGDYAPATNIAKTALASGVQTSLGKADTAVQPSDIGIPAFSTTATYVRENLVVHNNAVWVCLEPSIVPGEWIDLYWRKLFDLDTGAPASGGTKLITNGQVHTALAGKLDSSSAAPAFSESSTYAAGEYVTYNGGLYVCSTAVTTAGAWTGSTNWTAKDMTTPDATLDILPDGTLRVSSPGGTLWRQGYDLASESSATLPGNHVNYYAFAATTAAAFSDETAYAADDRIAYNGKVYKFTSAHSAGAWDSSVVVEDPDTQALALPTAAAGKVGDFGLDVDNSANTVETVITLTGLDNTFSVVVPKGESLVDMLTFAGGELAVLYFTLTAFKVNNLPTWQVLKQVVENGGAQP